MTTIKAAPEGVQEWLSMQTAGTLDRERIRQLLSPDGALVFAGRESVGADRVYEQLAGMPSGGGEMELSIVPNEDPHMVTVRGTGPDGAPLASPGGPMSAMDFVFTLADDGRIDRIEPHPHHTEPRDLAAALPVGTVAPDFTLPDVDGSPVRLDAGSRRATVVVFTCNPCPWALGWHDRIQQVSRDYADRGVQVLQINANDPAVSPKDAIDVSRGRVARGDFAGPYLMDAGQRVARAWGARHTPDVFVLDRFGMVVYHGAPDASVDIEDLNARWLRDAVDAALSGTTPHLASTEPVGCTIKWTL